MAGITRQVCLSFHGVEYIITLSSAARKLSVQVEQKSRLLRWKGEFAADCESRPRFATADLSPAACSLPAASAAPVACSAARGQSQACENSCVLPCVPPYSEQMWRILRGRRATSRSSIRS